MTSRPITMAKAAPHGPGEMVSSSLIGWNTSCHLYRMHTAHSKKVDTCIAPPIHVSGHGARHQSWRNSAALGSLGAEFTGWGCVVTTIERREVGEEQAQEEPALVGGGAWGIRLRTVSVTERLRW